MGYHFVKPWKLEWMGMEVGKGVIKEEFVFGLYRAFLCKLRGSALLHAGTITRTEPLAGFNN